MLLQATDLHQVEGGVALVVEGHGEGAAPQPQHEDGDDHRHHPDEHAAEHHARWSRRCRICRGLGGYDLPFHVIADRPRAATRSRRPPAWSRVVSASSAPIWCMHWSEAGHTCEWSTRSSPSTVATSATSRASKAWTCWSRTWAIQPSPRLVQGADVVFNVAGQVSHHASMTDPLLDLDLNVRSHLAFLETLRQVAPRTRVVLTSTRQVYGRPERLPVDETHPAHPVDVNGVDKLAGEQLHLLYTTVHGLPTTALRLTNVYGPRQNLTREGLGVLPVFLRRALEGQMIELYGDGLQRRDCLHVDDVVKALAMATSDAAIGEVVNLGHPTSSTLREIAESILRAAGRPVEVELRPVAVRPGQHRHRRLRGRLRQGHAAAGLEAGHRPRRRRRRHDPLLPPASVVPVVDLSRRGQRLAGDVPGRGEAGAGLGPPPARRRAGGARGGAGGVERASPRARGVVRCPRAAAGARGRRAWARATRCSSPRSPPCRPRRRWWPLERCRCRSTSTPRRRSSTLRRGTPPAPTGRRPSSWSTSTVARPSCPASTCPSSRTPRRLTALCARRGRAERSPTRSTRRRTSVASGTGARW